MITISLDGNELPDLKVLFKLISEELQFPKYATTIQGFERQLNDLRWLEGVKVRISLVNAKNFLFQEDMQVRRLVLQILISAMEDGKANSPILVLISKD